MEAHELLAQARETFGVRREYGEPYVADGVTVIPVSSVRGGGGGGSGHDGHEGGGGFGLTAKPSGAWVIRGENVEWKPAVDPVRVLLGAELVAALALIRKRPRKRHLLDRHLLDRGHHHRGHKRLTRPHRPHLHH